tara:strand:- start:140 stop:598 length:459 start_codon:yes stop_codon:yes gene_type:complete
MGKKEKQVLEALILIVVCSILIIFAYQKAYESEKKNKPKLTPYKFLNIDKMPPLNNILVGMASGMVFGFIDNAGLFLGMDVLDPFLSKSPLIKAGQGNTFSDVIGTFLGTFIGLYIKNETGIDDSPIWADALGVFIGCLIGVYLPSLITGKK